MNRFERMFGILLHLLGGRQVSAKDLSRKFEVSVRTIHRDLEMLSALGIPLYAERGRVGGFRLLDGYYVPPLMFTREEAVSLLLAVTLMESLQVRPAVSAMESARMKLLAAVPGHVRSILEHAEKVIGFEAPPLDVFHPEPLSQQKQSETQGAAIEENEVVSVFLDAILASGSVQFTYSSPYRKETKVVHACPQCLFYDRGHWYLVGELRGHETGTRLWRSDRVLDIQEYLRFDKMNSEADVREYLGRKWLKDAMDSWLEGETVQIRMNLEQADRLSQDWFYEHAKYEKLDDHIVLVTYGEDDPNVVMELLRWLGPGAELIEPKHWRKIIRAELETMLDVYNT